VAFQALSAPAKPLAIALHLGPEFTFLTPTLERIAKVRAPIAVP
jgi:hypothetical protein